MTTGYRTARITNLGRPFGAELCAEEHPRPAAPAPHTHPRRLDTTLAVRPAREGEHPDGRGTDRIRCAKDTGLGRLPSRAFAINQAWCTAAAIAADLIAWLQLVALDGELALAEPKRLRYRLLHTSARLVRGQRRRRLRIPATWPRGHPDHRRIHPDRGHPRPG